MWDVRPRLLGGVASPLLGVTCVIVSAATLGYLVLLGQQGSFPGIDARIALVLALLVGFAILSGVGALAESVRLRAVVAAACAAGLLPLGVLALFSIGLPLVIAGGLAFVVWLTAVRDSSSRETIIQSLAAAATAVGLLGLGLAATG